MPFFEFLESLLDRIYFKKKTQCSNETIPYLGCCQMRSLKAVCGTANQTQMCVTANQTQMEGGNAKCDASSESRSECPDTGYAAANASWSEGPNTAYDTANTTRLEGLDNLAVLARSAKPTHTFVALECGGPADVAQELLVGLVCLCVCVLVFVVCVCLICSSSMPALCGWLICLPYMSVCLICLPYVFCLCLFSVSV